MKTVVQTILEMSKNLNGVGFHNWITNHVSELLEKEKEQIIKAANDGVNEGIAVTQLGAKRNFHSGEDYYTKTYPKTTPIDNTKNLNHG